MHISFSHRVPDTISSKIKSSRAEQMVVPDICNSLQSTILQGLCTIINWFLFQMAWNARLVIEPGAVGGLIRSWRLSYLQVFKSKGKGKGKTPDKKRTLFR